MTHISKEMQATPVQPVPGTSDAGNPWAELISHAPAALTPEIAGWLVQHSSSLILECRHTLRDQLMLQTLRRPLSADSQGVLAGLRLAGRTGNSAGPLAQAIREILSHEPVPGEGALGEIARSAVILKIVQALGPRVRAGCPHCGSQRINWQSTMFGPQAGTNLLSTHPEDWSGGLQFMELDALWNTQMGETIWLDVSCRGCGEQGWPFTMVMPCE